MKINFSWKIFSIKNNFSKKSFFSQSNTALVDLIFPEKILVLLDVLRMSVDITKLTMSLIRIRAISYSLVIHWALRLAQGANLALQTPQKKNKKSWKLTDILMCSALHADWWSRLEEEEGMGPWGGGDRERLLAWELLCKGYFGVEDIQSYVQHGW